jgi:hypothetical protein
VGRPVARVGTNRSAYLRSLERRRSARGLPPAGRSAVLQGGIGEADLADDVATDRAFLALAAVHTQAALLLGLEVLRGQAGRPFHRVPQGGLHRVVQLFELSGRQVRRRFEGLIFATCGISSE